MNKLEMNKPYICKENNDSCYFLKFESSVLSTKIPVVGVAMSHSRRVNDDWQD